MHEELQTCLRSKNACIWGTVRLLESWHKGIGSMPSLQPCTRFSALENTRASADNCVSSPPRCPCSPTASGSASDASYVSESPPQPARQAAPGVLFRNISNLPSASVKCQSDLLAQTCLRTQRCTQHLAASLRDPAACANNRFYFTAVSCAHTQLGTYASATCRHVRELARLGWRAAQRRR